MKDPFVDDSTQVVELIRPMSPSTELTEALQMDMKEKDVHSEEKKEEDNGLEEEEQTKEGELKPALTAEEEGQEALWVEESASMDSPVARSSPGRRSFFGGKKKSAPSIKAAPSAAATKATKTTKATKSTQKTVQSHVVLLEKEQKAPALKSVDVEEVHGDPKLHRAAVARATTARMLLEQALGNTGKGATRIQLAKTAFSHAKEARKIIDVELTTEVEKSIEEAREKGEAAVARIEELDQSSSKDKKSEKKGKKEKKAKSNESVEELATCARDMLEFVLPASLPKGATQLLASSPGQCLVDDISTLGFDNTFTESKGTPKELDLLSMSSLNEILDGPVEESPEKQNAAPKESKSDDAANKKSVQKRKPFFSSLFRSGKSQPVSEGQSKDKDEKTTVKSEPPKAPQNPKKVQRFVASVVVKDGDEPEEKEEPVPDLKDLEKLKDLDENLHKALQSALMADDTESITSLDGVPMFGKQVKPKNDKKNKKKAKKKGVEEEERRPLPTRKDPETVKPAFVAVPSGAAAAILSSKSWESLKAEEVIPVSEPDPAPLERSASVGSDSGSMSSANSNFTSDTGSQATPKGKEAKRKARGFRLKGKLKKKVEPPARIDKSESLAEAPSMSPSSTVDKYTVASESNASDDRYMVMNEDFSFEALLNPCGPSGILMGPSMTSGMTSGGTLTEVTSMDSNDGTEATDKYTNADEPRESEDVPKENVELQPAENVPPVLSEQSENKPKDENIPEIKEEKPKVEPKGTGLIGGLFGLGRGKKSAPKVIANKKEQKPKGQKKAKQTRKEKSAAAKIQMFDSVDPVTEAGTSEQDKKQLSPTAATEVTDLTKEPTAEGPDEEQAVDPLVAQIKQQKHRQRRGRDPATKHAIPGEHRGIDP